MGSCWPAYRAAVVPSLARLESAKVAIVTPDRFGLVLLHGVDANCLKLFDLDRDDALVLGRGVAGGDGHPQLLAILLIEAIRAHGVAIGLDQLFGLGRIMHHDRVLVIHPRRVRRVDQLVERTVRWEE